MLLAAFKSADLIPLPVSNEADVRGALRRLHQDSLGGRLTRGLGPQVVQAGRELVYADLLVLSGLPRLVAQLQSVDGRPAREQAEAALRQAAWNELHSRTPHP